MISRSNCALRAQPLRTTGRWRSGALPLPALALLLAAVMAGAPPLAASDNEAPASFSAQTPDEVVDRGLLALKNLQQADGTYQEGTAITALAGMAFLAGGSTAQRGTYREASAKCLEAIIAHQDKITGYLASSSPNMYSHGFATLYLAEHYGMAPDQKVRRALEAALELIYYAQNREGGWRYNPVPDDADLSVTICQVMALRAAYNAGVGGEQTQEAMNRALAYVRRCANPSGSFSYQASMAGGDFGMGPEGVPRTAAGCMCLIGMGVNDVKDRNLGPGLQFLRHNYGAHLRSGDGYFWYGQYYTAQAMFHSPDPADWDAYWKTAWPIIARRQGQDGLWNQGEGPGPGYDTAMALIILQIPNNYLPIFER
jgi:hypothetical protein